MDMENPDAGKGCLFVVAAAIVICLIIALASFLGSYEYHYAHRRGSLEEEYRKASTEIERKAIQQKIDDLDDSLRKERLREATREREKQERERERERSH